MKSRFILYCFLSFFFIQAFTQSKPALINSDMAFDYIGALKDTLNAIAEESDEEFFVIHCESIIKVIEAKSSLYHQDSLYLEDLYNAYNDISDPYSMKDFTTYLERRRSLILAWTSPTDGATSFSWLKLPANWDPGNEYPLYIQLHGLWDVAGNTISYLTYPFLQNPSTSTSFEDGYLLSPWGRGNLWYQGISETDIWECMAALKEIASINPRRTYLSGHSMGGYGAWHIALNSPEVWAALGVHAGALGYNSSSELNEAAAETLKDLPTYFVCGTIDGLLSLNQTAYALLEEAGNTNIEFVTFTGGHEYLEENVLHMYLWMKEYENDDLNPIEEFTRSDENRSQFRNYPNPVNGSTTFCFTLYRPEYITVEIYNYAGQIQETITQGHYGTGDHELKWNSASLSRGIYFCQFTGSTYTYTIKLLINN